MMSGRERMWRIRRYYLGVAKARTQLFMVGLLPWLPCYGDEIDDMLAKQLDQVSGPIQLGLWHWEDER